MFFSFGKNEDLSLKGKERGVFFLNVKRSIFFIMNGENGGFSIGKSEILFLMGEVHFCVVTSVVQLSTFRLIFLYQ